MSTAKPRGFALLTTLAAMVLALMLMGAFFSSHRSHLTLSRLDDDKRACQDAILALTDYCRFRLEKERQWGKNPATIAIKDLKDDYDRVIFHARQLSDEEVESSPTAQELEGQTHIVGDMPGNGVTFHLALTNNLTNLNSSTQDGVRAKACRLRLEATRGSARERVEVRYRTSAYFDSTLAASDQININVGGGDRNKLILRSKDPVHNELRSLNDAYLPKPNDILMRPEQTNVASVRGTVWAQQDIGVGLTSAEEDAGQSSSAATLDTASRKTGGQFVANGRNKYGIPELSLAEARTTVEGLPEQDIRCGDYYFNETVVSYNAGGVEKTAAIPTLQRFEPQDEHVQGRLTDFHFIKSALPDCTDYSSVRVTNDETGAGKPHSYAEDDFSIPRGPDRVSLHRGAKGSASGPFKPSVFFLADQDLVVKSEVNESGTRVPGDFRLRGSDLELTPRILFTDNVSRDENYEPPEPDPDDPNPPPLPRGYITTERDLTMEGRISGGGRLIAGRNVTLQANKISISSGAQEDIAIYAGKNVTIVPPVNDDADGEGQDEVESKFSFKGLIYAKNSFRFRSETIKWHDVDDPSDDEVFVYDVDLEIEGAVVARHGSVLIDGNRKVELIYNPAFLDDFLEQKYVNGEVKIEQLSWRPI